MKDTQFYNNESSEYSEKRYPVVAQSYTQFFFTRRLAITKNFLKQIFISGQHPALLEIGCADGIIIRDIENSFPGVFSKLSGIDISAGMIEEAHKRNTSMNAEFLLRSEYAAREPVSVVVETGVINYSRFEDDILYAYNNLKVGGYYILSVAGTGSLRNRLKHESGFNDFRSYKEYEFLLRQKFIVRSVRGCGLFVPYIWKIPPFGRILQPIADSIVGALFPGLCHEKLYLLEKK